MTGVSEILVLILLICGILILPRMIKPAPENVSSSAPPSLTKKRRAGIVASILFPLFSALLLKPWQGNLVLFIAVGIVPVALAWAVVWVMAGSGK